jgi:NADH:ubiquinone oxidoreductase subunit E
MSESQNKIYVCNGPWCQRYKSAEIFKILKEYFLGEEVLTCNCVGACETAPNIKIGNGLIKGIKPEKVIFLVEDVLKNPEKIEQKKFSFKDFKLDDLF